MPHDSYEPVVFALRKNLPLASPTNGKLVPLFYSDRRPIENRVDDFPNAGEIFVSGGFDTVPDTLLEVYPEPVPPGGLISEDSPNYCKYRVRAGGVRPSVIPAEGYGDLISLDGFPEFNSEWDIPFKPTKYIFIQRVGSEEVRGPFRTHELSLRDEFGCRIKLIPAYPTDWVCGHIPQLKDQLLVRFAATDLDAGAIMTFSGLRANELGYDNRTFVDIRAVIELTQQITEGLYVDAMSDTDLMDWGRKLINEKSTVSRADAKQFRDLILGIREQQVDFGLPTGLLQARIDRLTQSLTDSIAIQSLIDASVLTLLDRYAETPEGRDVFDRYIEQRKPEVAEGIRKQVLVEEQKRLKDARDDAEREIAKVRLEYEALVKKNEELRKESTQQRLEALTNEHRSLQEKVGKLNKEVDHYEWTKDRLSNLITELKKDWTNSQVELRAQIVQQKAILDELAGLPKEAGERRFPSFSIQGSSAPMSKGECVDQVTRLLRSHGRDVSTAETANYLTSILQSRFTVFAGYPGVGKTSLAMLLGKALGLGPGEDPRRMLKINVGRGWVSSRDLVGVYNPISHGFTPSETGLFPALTQLDDEVRHGGSTMPFWVLLDEMNLSSVEHYLSDFIAQADDRFGEVGFGGKSLRFDSALRFIGTVNYDETTETLSPRMLSRSHVIYIAPPKGRDVAVSEAHELELPLSATMENLRPFWDAKPEFDVDDVGEEVKFRELAAIMEQEHDEGKRLGRPIIMDSRVILAIKQYCNAVRDLIRPERGKYGALDFAFAQRVLTRVRGSGPDYGRRLLKLKDHCESAGMVESVQTLKRVLDNGQEHDEYDFFAF